ncbi:hypothetical protein QCA50_016991 [Cerrena zonata]|uniref:2OGFeDO JBP1/TET oxygenase domain-containing protein n=1 Tax=Cerrena zonata TaxID=2478898 RepID=A0AAW0FM00_9APHY
MPIPECALDTYNAHSRYMHTLFKAELARQTGSSITVEVDCPIACSVEMALESRNIVQCLVEAYLHPVHVTWDIEKYRTECIRRQVHNGMQKDKEVRLQKDFPSVRRNMRLVHSPRTVVDKYGRIIAWLLPGILPQRLQLLIAQCAELIAPEMGKQLRQSSHTKSWRSSEEMFTTIEGELPPGLLNFSAAWFMLGREGRIDGLVSSPIVRTECGQQWMQEFAQVGAIISGMLRIMHPDQYRMGYEVMTRLMTYPEVNDTLISWPCIFNAATVISSRCCPMHRDTKGSFPLFDLLISTGKYTTAPLSLLPIGVQLPNCPGSISSFSGMGFSHGVAHAEGARVCHAFYMRQALQVFTNVIPCSWMTQDTYKQWIGDRSRGNITVKLDLESI